MMSEFFDTYRDARAALDAVDSVGSHLSALGISAGVTIHTAVDRLTDCIETFKRLDGEAIAQRLHDAEAGTANMLAVAIGMARLTGDTQAATPEPENKS
jgi:hypothetical protein